jgi:hypothetical protein
MDRIGSVVDCSSELGPGITDLGAFTATLTIAMILVADTMDRFQDAGNRRSITSMRTRLVTGKVTLGMLAMMEAVNTAPELKGATAAVATRLWGCLIG